MKVSSSLLPVVPLCLRSPLRTCFRPLTPLPSPTPRSTPSPFPHTCPLAAHLLPRTTNPSCAPYAAPSSLSPVPCAPAFAAAASGNFRASGTCGTPRASPAHAKRGAAQHQ